MRKFWFVLAGILLLAGAGFGIWLYWQNYHLAQTTQTETKKQTNSLDNPSQSTAQPKDTNDKFIVKNPVDLSQIQAISKFRSCAGHDFSGFNVFGQKETNRSMKHYFAPLDSLKATKKIKIFAPFDGIITNISKSEGHNDYQIELQGPDTGEWVFIFMHVFLKSELQQFSVVKAGQEIGYAYVPKNCNDFDIALKKFEIPDSYSQKDEYLALQRQLMQKMVEGEQLSEEEMTQREQMEQQLPTPKEIYDSIFFHMTDSVLEEYQTQGVSLDNIIVSKAYRDAHPCNFNLMYTREEDWVKIK